MLARIMVIAGVATVIAIQVPSIFEKSREAPAAQPALEKVAVSEKQTVEATAHGNVRLKANLQGHYTGDFKINGRPVPGLIDTGATYVAVNETTARRLGFGLMDLDYRYSVSTANGKTQAAFVKLNIMEIGSIRVRDVDAVVLKDSALASTLVGVSFLKKLASYGVEDGSLHLVQ
jgi:aspartyl protease family protein